NWTVRIRSGQPYSMVCTRSQVGPRKSAAQRCVQGLYTMSRRPGAQADLGDVRVEQGERMAGETPGSQSALREANQRRLLRAIRSAGSLTQAQIARATGLSAATVSNIVRQLRDAGTVTVAPTSSGGRRAQSV